MDLDSYAENFSEALFNYLWFAERIIPATQVTDIFTKHGEAAVDVLEFVAEVAKVVVVLSVVTNSSFSETMERCFKHGGITRLSVFTFLAKYCFDNHAVTEDIFAVVLNTCTFVYMLVVHCNNQDHPEFVQFGAMCWTEIFEWDLKDEFHAKGGWNEFRSYMAEKRFVLKGGDADQNVIVLFLEEISEIFPKLTLESPDPSCQNSPDAMANLESSCVEGVDKPQTNCEAAAFSFGTDDLIASNVPGFNENSEECAGGVGKPQTNGGETEYDRFTSNIPGYNEESDCCVEGVDKPASEFSFGTVDLIASDIPGFNEKSKAVEFQFDNLDSKIVQLSERFKRKTRGKPSLPSRSPVFNTTLIEKNLACPSMQNTVVDHYSIERKPKSEDIVFKSSTVETSTTIQEDSREEMVEANSGEGFDSDVEVAAPKAFSYIESSFFSGTFRRSSQEGMQTADDQTTCEDASRLEVENSGAVNPPRDFDELYINGVCYEEYVILNPASFTIDPGTDCNGEEEPDDETSKDSLV